MDRIAERLAERGVGSIFLYTNEAHPGERFPHLTTMEQKHRHASALIDHYGLRRPMYLDALEGGAHQAFGGQPNMTWILAKSGMALYKCDWTDAASVESALDYYLGVAERRRAKKRMVPFRVERIDFREQNREAFYEGLEKAGPKAVQEFDRAFGPRK